MRVSRSAAAACAAASLFLTMPVTAQIAPPPGATEAPVRKPADKSVSGDIIVTGRKPVQRKDALTYARDTSVSIDGQLARFNDPVCPMVIAFPKVIAEQIVARIRDVAEAAGLRVAKAGCKGNVVLIATDNGSAVIRELKRRGASLLGGLDPFDVDRLIKDPGPVHAWTLTQLENEEGEKPIVPMVGLPETRVRSVSHINPSTQQAIYLSVVMVDWPVMYGKSSVQIADYAAMRTLAITRPAKGDGVVDTILALFDPAAKGLPELSAADLAYLQSLYAMPGTRSDRYQMLKIGNDVLKASDAEAGTPRSSR